METPHKWSLHAGCWKYAFEGTTNRKPDTFVQYRGWSKRIYHFGKATIVINKRIVEVWVRHKAGISDKLIYAAYLKADKAARDFAEFARIAITPIHTPHPSGIANAHLVLKTRAYNEQLKPIAGTEQTERTGLIFDKSHPNMPELTGEYSAHGAIGFDWVCLVLPKAFNELRAQIELLKEENKMLAEALSEIASAHTKSSL
jgi:hypothetical protein